MGVHRNFLSTEQGQEKEKKKERKEFGLVNEIRHPLFPSLPAPPVRLQVNSIFQKRRGYGQAHIEEHFEGVQPWVGGGAAHFHARRL